MVTRAPIEKIAKFVFRIDSETLVECRVETFYSPRGRYCILVTERSDNPGPSVTDCHDALRKAIFKHFSLATKQLTYSFYERYDRDSYAPPRDDLTEVCQVYFKNGKPHWEHVPDDEWEALYYAPRKPKVEYIVRKGDEHAKRKHRSQNPEGSIA